MFRDVGGLVLAGGSGTRMGTRDKCLMPVDGIPVVRRVLALLTELFEELVLVTNNPEEYSDLVDSPLAAPQRLLLTGDRYRGRGPLAGLHAGLCAASCPAVFCVACDMPFLDGGLISRQVESFRSDRRPCEALIPRVGELIEPLHAVYARSLAERVERILNEGSGNSLRLLLAQAHTLYWDLEDSAASRSAFFNINTPKDLVSLQMRQGRSGS